MQKRFLAGLTVAALLGGFVSCSLDPEIAVALTVSTTGVGVKSGDTSRQIVYQVIPATAAVTMSSSDTGVVTVSNSGVVTIVGAGLAAITVTASNDGDSLSKTIPVSVAEQVAGYSFEGMTSTSVADAVGVDNTLELALFSSTASITACYPYTPAKVGSTAIYWPNDQVGGSISGGLLTSDAAGITLSAYVNVIGGSSWINFVNFINGTSNERFDYPNLTLSDTGNAYTGSGYGDLLNGYPADAFYNSLYKDANGWAHLTLVINAMSNSVTYYVNGNKMIEYSSTALSDNIANVIAAATSGSVVFGYQNWEDGASAIDDLRIYTGPMDDASVAALYAAY